MKKQTNKQTNKQTQIVYNSFKMVLFNHSSLSCFNLWVAILYFFLPFSLCINDINNAEQERKNKNM